MATSIRYQDVQDRILPMLKERHPGKSVLIQSRTPFLTEARPYVQVQYITKSKDGKVNSHAADIPGNDLVRYQVRELRPVVNDAAERVVMEENAKAETERREADVKAGAGAKKKGGKK